MDGHVPWSSSFTSNWSIGPYVALGWNSDLTSAAGRSPIGHRIRGFHRDRLEIQWGPISEAVPAESWHQQLISSWEPRLERPLISLTVIQDISHQSCTLSGAVSDGYWALPNGQPQPGRQSDDICGDTCLSNVIISGVCWKVLIQ